MIFHRSIISCVLMLVSSRWWCGHIYDYLANFHEQNPVITIGIYVIRNFMWGQKLSPCRFCNRFKLVRFTVSQQKTAWFKREYCVSCASYCYTIDNSLLSYAENEFMWPYVYGEEHSRSTEHCVICKNLDKLLSARYVINMFYMYTRRSSFVHFLKCTVVYR